MGSHVTRFAAALCVCLAGLLGCARLQALKPSSSGAAEQTEMPPESIVHSGEKWVSFASSEPLSPPTRADVEVRWARQNYGTSGWKPVALGPANDDDRFSGSKWIWYPMEEFTFGANNSLPDNRRAVHFRRIFYNERLKSDMKNAYVDVMGSGKITYRVFVNGRLIKSEGDEELRSLTPIQRQQQLRNRSMNRSQPGQSELMDRVPYRYEIRDYLTTGKNVIAIEAVARIQNNPQGGSGTPNFVRDGIIAKVVLE